MKRAMVTDRKPYFLSQAISNLEKSGEICVKSWIVFDKEMSQNEFAHKNKIWWFDIALSYNNNQEINLSQSEIDLIHENYYIFEQSMAREKLTELLAPYEIKNIIFKFAHFFKNEIVNKNIEVVIFQDIPHGPFELILYHIAKFNGCKTIFFMLVNETLSNIYENLDDIGKFELNSDNKFDLDKKHEKNLPYMKKMGPKDKFKKKAKILNLANYLKDKKSTHQHSKFLYDDVWSYLNLHIIRKLKRTEQKRIYKKLYKSNFNGSINENDKFVYFPLHLQPEATTDTLGGIYCDQILAIENLRKIVPNEYKIYIKENPKQTYYMRGKHFFDRLKSIPNVVLLDKSVNTYELIKKCEFVATITGTAGWEAISGGKNALVFGLAWYRFMQGVSIYKDGIKFEEIVGKKIDFEKLKNEYYCFLNNAKSVAIVDYQANLQKDFSKDLNAKKLSKELISILQN